MVNKSNANIYIDYLESKFPDATCFLNYSKDYELLIAVMLSAQTTDKKVNEATKVLFNKFDSLEKLQNADVLEIEKIIKPLGLAKTKSQNCAGIAGFLIKNYDSKVPNNKEELMKLPGVGNKTANVVLIELFDAYEFPVDTHIARISKRLGIAKDDDNVLIIEEKLKKFFPKENWKKLHHQLILFGRNICDARKPKCNECGLKDYCKFYKSLSIASK